MLQKGLIGHIENRRPSRETKTRDRERHSFYFLPHHEDNSETQYISCAPPDAEAAPASFMADAGLEDREDSAPACEGGLCSNRDIQCHSRERDGSKNETPSRFWSKRASVRAYLERTACARAMTSARAHNGSLLRPFDNSIELLDGIEITLLGQCYDSSRV